jgi:hypothetical protein
MPHSPQQISGGGAFSALSWSLHRPRTSPTASLVTTIALKGPQRELNRWQFAKDFTRSFVPSDGTLAKDRTLAKHLS